MTQRPGSNRINVKSFRHHHTSVSQWDRGAIFAPLFGQAKSGNKKVKD
jgi:hypothetical protein